jgi:hypothetical protein
MFGKLIKMLGHLATWERYVLAAVIAMAGVILLLVVKQESITPDEVVHITAGLSYIQQHDGRMNPEHPPLEKMLAALPLAFQGAKLSYENAAWTSPDEVDFAWASLRDWGLVGARRVYLARLPMIILTLILAISVFLMARSLSSIAGGMLSLAVFVTSPFFFAYGPLILTDIGIALFALLTVWTFASLWQNPDLKRSAIFGLAFSGALLSKFSSGLLLPTLVLLGAWFGFRPISSTADSGRATRLSFVGVFLASLIVYVTYAMVFWPTKAAWLLSYRFEHFTRPQLAILAVANTLRAHPWLERISYPAVLYVLGVSSTLHGLARPTYLLGQVYPRGTRLFFPTLFLYKMTPGFLCLATLLLCLWIWKLIVRKPPAKNDCQSYVFHVRGISILFFVFTLTAVLSPLNIGIRHLSVPIAALTVLLSLIVPWSSLLSNACTRTAIWSLAVIAVMGGVISMVVAFPHYLGYFNRLKGTKPSYEIAVGADLDWGQSLIELRDFMQTHQVGSIKIDVRGSILKLYLPAVQEFKCEDGVPADAEWVAVGASRFITGIDLKIHPTMVVPHCSYLFNYPYWVNASGALYVFQVKHIRTQTEMPSPVLLEK